MSLSRADWSVRVGIIPTLIESTDDPDVAAGLIGQLTAWRYNVAMNLTLKHQWIAAVDKGRATSSAQRAFYHELSNKKVGLFGHGVSTSADYPMDLARHPWALKENEFQAAYAAVMNEEAPTMIPDDRARVSAAMGYGAGAVGGVGGALRLMPLPAAKAAGAIVGAGASLTAGVALGVAGTSSLLDSVEWSKFKAKIGDYQAIYKRERDYRTAERQS